MHGLDGGVILVDEHGFYHQQVVVERDNRVEASDEHQDVEPFLRGCGKDKEFAEETGKGRDSCQGEKRKHHDEAESRIGLIQPIVVVDGYLAGAVLDDADDTEYGKVGYHVNQDVVDQGGHPQFVPADNTQEDVARL